jgi:hypothetical protein
MSCEEEDTCMPYEEEDTCMPYEEEVTHLFFFGGAFQRDVATEEVVESCDDIECLKRRQRRHDRKAHIGAKLWAGIYR